VAAAAAGLTTQGVQVAKRPRKETRKSKVEVTG